MSKQTFTTEEASNVAKHMSIWTNRIMRGSEYPIMMITVEKADKTKLKIHRSAEFTNDQLREFLHQITLSL